MPVRSRRPEDERPLFKALNEQRLFGPVGPGQNGASQASGQQEEEPRSSAGAEQASSPQAGGASQGEKGPIARALDRAQENNWVYDSVANMIRERGLAAKADELLSKLGGR